MTSLEKIINAYSYSLGDAIMGVFGKDIYGKKTVDINAKHRGFAASVIKVPVMVETFCQLYEGKIGIDLTLEMKKEYVYNNLGRDSLGHSKSKFSKENNKNTKIIKCYNPPKIYYEENIWVDDYPFYGHKSYSYNHYDIEYSKYSVGRKYPLFDLLADMILNSDNEATNMLADHMGLDNINRRMKKLGLRNTKMSHLIQGLWDYDEGSNDTSAFDMGMLLEKIYSSDFLDKPCRGYMKNLLNHFGTGFNGCVTNKLPEEVSSSGKVGIIDQHHHEAAVIDDRYIICVMIYNHDEYDHDKNFLNIGTSNAIADISRRVYSLINEEKHELSKNLR